MIVENSTKAIIVVKNEVLLIKNKPQFDLGEWYCLPGGRQNPGENLYETLIRECQEEIAITPKISRLLFVREYIHENHRLKDLGKPTHKIEFMFLISLDKNSKPKQGNTPDPSQKNLEWISLDAIDKINIYPTKLKELNSLLKSEKPVYWGDVF